MPENFERVQAKKKTPEMDEVVVFFLNYFFCLNFFFNLVRYVIIQLFV